MTPFGVNNMRLLKYRTIRLGFEEQYMCMHDFNFYGRIQCISIKGGVGYYSLASQRLLV